MNTPARDDPQQPDGTDLQETPAPSETQWVELGKVSDTQGGLIGSKPDSGYGWQYY